MITLWIWLAALLFVILLPLFLRNGIPRPRLPKWIKRIPRWVGHRRWMQQDHLWEMRLMDRRKPPLSVEERTERNLFAKQWGNHPTLTRRQANAIKRSLRRDSRA